MLPPPEQSFDTKEELVTFAKDWALSQGYGIATHSSMAIEQHFAYRCLSGNTSSKKNALKTKKTGCGFRFTGNFYKKTGKWTIVVKNGEHNHSPFEKPNDLAYVQCLVPEDKKLTKEMEQAGCKRGQIYYALSEIHGSR